MQSRHADRSSDRFKSGWSLSDETNDSPWLARGGGDKILKFLEKK